ncbi:MAG: bifunctional diguanylate cyclase/phosphodiesterase [Pseudomonadota bacterium]
MRLRLPQFLSSFPSPAGFVVPAGLAMIPGLTWMGYQLWGEATLVAAAVLGPILCLSGYAQLVGKKPAARPDALEDAIDQNMRIARRGLRRTACMFIEIDDIETLLDRFGQSAFDHVCKTTSQRMRVVLRDGDTLLNLSSGQFGVAIAPVRKLDSDVCVQITTRMQEVCEQPIDVDDTKIYITISAGICLQSALKRGGARDLSDAATLALQEARRYGPSSVRVFSPALIEQDAMQPTNDIEAVRGLKAGEIIAWFQPQISTDTGEISGFEALARWQHPARGLIPPGEFLQILRDQGQLGHLGQKILRDSLSALQQWDKHALNIRQIGINCSPEELRDPKLVDRIAWELDRYGIAPNRLAIEVLETVVAYSSDDTVARNVRRLGELGCQIDLDDFGTGHASISSIRRFGVHRLKIDRSFVQKVDKDTEQQRMVNAIQLMAEQLELETIAEGVETAGEHNMLAQLGCHHVQGFGLGHPMPFEKTLAWIAAYRAQLQKPPKIDRSAG